MARFKRGVKRKRGYRRFKRRGTSRKLKRAIKRGIQSFAEKKALDGSAATTANNSGTITVLNGTLTQGTGSSARVGTTVRLRSVKIRLIFSNEASTTQARRWRITVGVWKDYDRTSPLNTRLYQNPTSESTTLLNREELQLMNWKPMFDKAFIVQQPSWQRLMVLSFHGKKLPFKRVTYNAGGLPDYAIFVAITTDYVGASPPGFALNHRITFTDV